MGWWSKELMGGDTPMDFEDEIYGICKTEKYPENWKPGDGAVEITRESFEQNLPEIIEMLEKAENNDYYDEYAIGYQVLGIMMMGAGASIDEELKSKIIEASNTDGWAKVDEERKKYVDEFHSALMSYDGTPVVITAKGLFQTIAEHLADGKTK